MRNATRSGQAQPRPMHDQHAGTRRSQRRSTIGPPTGAGSGFGRLVTRHGGLPARRRRAVGSWPGLGWPLAVRPHPVRRRRVTISVVSGGRLGGHVRILRAPAGSPPAPLAPIVRRARRLPGARPATGGPFDCPRHAHVPSFSSLAGWPSPAIASRPAARRPRAVCRPCGVVAAVLVNGCPRRPHRSGCRRYRTSPASRPSPSRGVGARHGRTNFDVLAVSLLCRSPVVLLTKRRYRWHGL